MDTGKLIFITIPNALRDHLAHHFPLNSSIPLPVELAPGSEELDADSLSPEKIISGILRDLAQNPKGEHSDYYRKLVIAVKPTILGELQEAAVLKARNGDYETALEIYDLLEGLYPQHPVLLLNRALVLEDRAGAMEQSAGPQKIEAAFAEAEDAYEAALVPRPLPGKQAGVLPEFPAERASASEGSLPDTLFNAGFFYEKRGEYRRAADCLTAYLETYDEESGTALEDEEKLEKAQELLDEIRNNGLDDDAFMEAISLIRQGAEEKGILKVKEFLERRPGAGRGWFVLGWGLRRLGRWEDGEACFLKALELGCGNANTLNELAICRMEQGDLENAQKDLEQALRLDPDNVKIISNMGILALKQEDDERAAAFFRTVLELEPEDPIAKAFFG
jgi:tetratricopeptide (TPR) repeat protein